MKQCDCGVWSTGGIHPDYCEGYAGELTGKLKCSGLPTNCSNAIKNIEIDSETKLAFKIGDEVRIKSIPFSGGRNYSHEDVGKIITIKVVDPERPFPFRGDMWQFEEEDLELVTDSQQWNVGDWVKAKGKCFNKIIGYNGVCYITDVYKSDGHVAANDWKERKKNWLKDNGFTLFIGKLPWKK